MIGIIVSKSLVSFSVDLVFYANCIYLIRKIPRKMFPKLLRYPSRWRSYHAASLSAFNHRFRTYAEKPKNTPIRVRDPNRGEFRLRLLHRTVSRSKATIQSPLMAAYPSSPSTTRPNKFFTSRYSFRSLLSNSSVI